MCKFDPKPFQFYVYVINHFTFKYTLYWKASFIEDFRIFSIRSESLNSDRIGLGDFEPDAEVSDCKSQFRSGTMENKL